MDTYQFALFLRAAGALPIPVARDGKQPAIRWKQYQAGAEPEAAEWQRWLGGWRSGQWDVAVINGIGGWVAIDLDATHPHDMLPHALMIRLLDTLNLPTDYPWAGPSRGGDGRHVWLQVTDATLPTRLVWRYAERMVELRASEHYTILGRYGSVEHLPAIATIDQIVAALDELTGRACESESQPTHAQPPPPPARAVPIALATWEAMANAVRWAREGERNETLNRVAYTATRMALAGRLPLSDDQVASQLTEAASAAGLGSREIAATLASAQRAARADGPFPARSGAGPGRPRSDDPIGAQGYGADDPIGQLDILAYPLTDAGNAELFAALNRNRLRYDAVAEVWRVYEGGIWREDTSHAVIRAAIAAARTRGQLAQGIADKELQEAVRKWALASESATKIEAMIRLARAQPSLILPASARDERTDVIAAANGVLIHLPTGDTRELTPADHCLRALAVAYDPNATCPRFMRALDEIFDGDVALISYWQRWMGYVLTGHVREQQALLLYGDGANGKSTLLEVIALLLGDYAASAPFALFDASRHDQTAQYEFARLQGKRFIAIIETPEDSFLHEARLKAATGGDAIPARHPYGRPFDFWPSWKIAFALNHLPAVRGADRGIWRRLRPIPFRRSFERSGDPHLLSRLKTELPGILNWALAGARQWYEHGLGEVPTAVTQCLTEYQERSNAVLLWFSDCCIADASAETASAEVYSSYREWCETNGERARSARWLGAQLKQMGYEIVTRRAGEVTRKVVRGVRLRA
jgi:putative DNA primase/helicase